MAGQYDRLFFIYILDLFNSNTRPGEIQRYGICWASVRVALLASHACSLFSNCCAIARWSMSRAGRAPRCCVRKRRFRRLSWELPDCEVCCEIMLASGQLRTGGRWGPVRLFKTHGRSNRLSTAFNRKPNRCGVKHWPAKSGSSWTGPGGSCIT